MSATPSAAVIKAVESGTSTIIRRVEIYESDGETLWNPSPDSDPNFARLVSGSVSLDSTRDERRTLDMVLSNSDKLLEPNPNGGLWYDKIIKVFRGVEYAVADLPPAIAIIEAGAGSAPYTFRAVLNGLGFTRTDVFLNPTDVSQLTDYDIIVSFTGAVISGQAALLKSFYNSGKSVVTISTANDATVLPFVTLSAAMTGSVAWGIAPLTTDNPMIGVFIAETATPTAAGVAIRGIDTTAQRVATYTSGGYTDHFTAIVAGNASGGRWFDLHLPNVNGQQANKLLKAGILWSQNYQPTETWETQLGEFMIDNLNTQNFPYQVKITGRDYTKKLLLSKFENAVTFAKGTSLGSLVKDVATNAGIKKFKLPAMPETLTSAISADRGTERWALIHDACSSYNYELFMDNQGYLVARPFVDPAFGPITATFKTGPQGNLVSFDRTTNDSRLYNHIVVYGDPPDDQSDKLPFFGEVKNTQVGSPTAIDRIGDRYYSFASTFFTSNQQCLDYAKTLLKIHALESYELNVGAIVYPWLEVGELAEILDPDAGEFDPTRYLMDTLTIDLALGPMSFTAKRVTFVDDPNAQVVDTGDDDDEAA